MIQKVLGSGVQIFDGGEGTARETKRRLEEAGLLNLMEKTGRIQFENSLETGEILKLSHFLLEHKSNGNEF